MQKLALLLLPLAIAACVERDAVPANSAGTPTPSSTSAPGGVVYPDTAPPPPSTTPGGTTRIPGRGEGELESPATTPTEQAIEDDVLPDGSIDGAGGSGGVQESSEAERNTASGNEIDTEFDPARDPAVIDEGGATGFGGQTMSPESVGDGEMRPGDLDFDNDDFNNEIEPDELPMMPADVVDAGPAMIP